MVLTNSPLQLNCSSKVSFVPELSTEGVDPAVLSKSVYNKIISSLVDRPVDTNRPGWNYKFLREQYPLPAKHADLKQQVDDFLAMDQPKSVSKETLWVFSFGMWDIWNLAALPRIFGEAGVDQTTAVMFNQIERLYKASLEDTSVAFSDFWYLSDDAIVRKLTNNEPMEKNRNETEIFRVLIPKLIDVNILPGWNMLRPPPPSPHPVAEQVKNAAHLVERWNSNLQAHMDAWKKLPEPVMEGQEPIDTNAKKPNTRRDESHDILAPYPLRKTLLFNMPELPIDAIIESQLRHTSLHDRNSRGNASPDSAIYYDEAWRPCSLGDPTPAQQTEVGRAAKLLGIMSGLNWSLRTGGRRKTCSKPNGHLFETPFTLGERAIREVAQRASVVVKKHLYLEDIGDKVAREEDHRLVKRGSESTFRVVAT